MLHKINIILENCVVKYLMKLEKEKKDEEFYRKILEETKE